MATGLHLRSSHYYDAQPGWRHDYRFADWDLWVVLSGSAIWHAADGDRAIAAGDCFCFPPDTRHRIDLDRGRPLRLCATHFDVLDTRPMPTLHRRLDDLAFVSALLRRVVRAAGDRDGRAGSWLEALLAELMRQQQRASSPVPDAWSRQLDGLCTRILEHPEGDYRARVVARQLHCSPEHLSRRFSAHAGVALSAYVIGTRIARAQQLLRDTDLPVKAVADACGYASVHFFSRQFSARVGRTPTAWREGG